MKLTKFLGFLILLSLLLAGLAAPAVTSPLAQGPGMSVTDLSKVDPAVLDQMALNGEAEFYVILTVQADLSGAAALPTKVAKTTYVFDLLRETARQTQPPLTQYLDQQGLDYRTYYIANMIEVTGDRNAVEWLAARPDVARVVSPPDPRPEPVTRGAASEQPHVAAVEWNITRVHAPEVWAMGYNGTGMVVGDNDTGVEYTHPALVGKYRGNLGGGSFNHNYNWWDADGSSSVPVDYDGHGTHTMGTMVGDDGVGNQVGMAPGAQWVACAGMNLECFEFFLTPWDLTGSNPDPTKAPDAINNSWYDPSGFDYRPIVQALNAAGIAVIKSAGNQGSGCTTITNPGYVPEIIATAAFAQGDTIAGFSSRGPTSNYGPTILKPEVAAPGVNIRSSVPGGGYEGGWDGTSMAAPHSTGLVALMWSAAPCLQGDVPTTKQIMMDTAEAKIDAQCPPFVDHPNDVWGHGVLHAFNAVQAAIAHCGGLGGLEGTVTSVGSPLQDVAVRAEAAGGYNKTAYTDAAGLYAMQVLSDTYTVTASKYGYAPVVVPGVEVTSDMTTTLDIVMTALPVYTVSGYVRDAVSNAPLAATVQFLDAPEPPVDTNPATGYYSIQVAEGTWHLQATAPLHLADTQEVVVVGDITQDFNLDPLPCILLVDDDGNNPDVRSYYTQALDALGVDYNVWDLATQGDPAAADLIGYKIVIWFNGYPYSATFTSANEAAVAAYLDTGGNLLFSSQDYLYDAGLTTFGQNYLHISSFTSDVNYTSVTGANVYAGLGPYTLSYPFTNYSDRVNPDAQAVVAFTYPTSNYPGAVSYTGAFRTVFLGYPLEAVPLAGRTAILERTLEHFGGCGCEAVGILDVTAEATGCTATFSADLAGTPPFTYAWDFGAFGTSADPAPIIDFGVSGTYPYSLTVYNCAGASSDTVTDTVTVDCCEDVYNPGFSWEPVSPLEDQEVVFTGVASGAAPISFAWDYGDGTFGAGQTVTHTYTAGGPYTVVMTATNCAGSAATSTQTITVRSKVYIYLPIVVRGE